MIDTNILEMAQQMQDIKEGYLALRELLGGVAVGGVSLLTIICTVLYKLRSKFLNTAVVTHLETIATDAVAQGKGLAQTLADTRTRTP